MLKVKSMQSPVGKLRIFSCDNFIQAILWENEKESRVKLATYEEVDTHHIIDNAISQLTQYFEGKRIKFDLPIKLKGTEFQMQVWQSITKIPWGETTSYGELADSIKKPKAYRAVGSATGKNPISIVVPCHRVIGSGKKLTGFAGGLDAKQALLNIERLF